MGRSLHVCCGCTSDLAEEQVGGGTCRKCGRDWCFDCYDGYLTGFWKCDDPEEGEDGEILQCPKCNAKGAEDEQKEQVARLALTVESLLSQRAIKRSVAEDWGKLSQSILAGIKRGREKANKREAKTEAKREKKRQKREAEEDD